MWEFQDTKYLSTKWIPNVIFSTKGFVFSMYLDQKYLSCVLCPLGDRNQRPIFPGGQLAGNQERPSLCINQRQTRINDIYTHVYNS